MFKMKDYLVHEKKEDLLSSLKELDSKIVQERLEYDGLETLEELRDAIIDDFEDCLNFSKSDPATKRYFKAITFLENSCNSEGLKYVYNDDIEALWLFVYKEDNKIGYYIPKEIRKIIKKILKI